MKRWQRLALPAAAAAFWWLLPLWVLGIAGVMAGAWQPSPAGLPLAFVASFLVALLVRAWARWQRERLIRESALPRLLRTKLREAYPHFAQKDVELVERGLRQFFLACLRSRRAFVAMPSRVVDAMWHEFILHTQAYRDWCRVAVGRFLDHTPAEVLGASVAHNDGLRRAWYWACKDEGIDPRHPSRLPLLFALDAKLEVANGFRYEPDCGVPRRRADASETGYVHCAASLGAEGHAAGDAKGFGGSVATASNGGDMGSSDAGSCGSGGD